MAAATVSSSPPTRRAYSESHPRPHLRSPLGHVTSHVTNHMTPPSITPHDQSRLGGRRGGERGEDVGREGEVSGESTEEVDAAPNESSTTTDTVPEPVDFIECGPAIPRAYSTSAIPVNGHHGHSVPGVISSSSFQGYENWSILVQMGQQHSHTPGYHSPGYGVRGRVGGAGVGSRGILQRKGKMMMRGGSKERQRLPHPAPRTNKIKNQHSRPVPISRKRRYSGRLSRPSHSVSEGDMAMADEMGEGEEGRDDGFVDCPAGEAVKRRSKKRGGGLHMVFPSMGQGNTASPPSSPSTTPLSSRRRASSRKSRIKPRSRKSMKQPKLASADISTQETTTPGPNSSDTTDTDSHDEAHTAGLGGPRGAGGSSESCDHNGVAEDGHHSHSGTPNLPSASTDSSSHFSGSEASGGLEYSSALEDAVDTEAIVARKTSTPGDSSRPFANHTTSSSGYNRVPKNGTSVSNFNSDENLHRDSTSDTDRTSLHPQHGSSSSILRKPRAPWSGKRLDYSDFSTAPLSSETSDMDTSGHEKVVSDGGGSTSDLTSLSRDSRASDLSSEVFSSSLQQKLAAAAAATASGSANSRPSSGESTETKKIVSGKTKSPVQKAVEGATPSPPVAKRPLKSSLSSPLKTDGRVSSPKSVSTVSASRTSLLSRMPPRPKPPPVANKPPVRPKPPVLNSSNQNNSSTSPQPQLYQRTKLRSAGDTDSVDYVSVESRRAQFGGVHSKSEQRVPLIGISKPFHNNIRKTSSESNVLSLEKGTGRPSPSSPTFVPRKLSNVREESEDKESDSEKLSFTTKPAWFSPTPRPQLLPTKSNLPLTSSPKTNSRKSPPPRPKPPQHKRVLPSNCDSNAESASSLPSSPLVAKRKPAPPTKPALLPRKPGLLLIHSSSEGNLASTSCKDSTTALSPTNPLTGAVSPPDKPPTKRRPYGRTITVPTKMGQTLTPDDSPSITPSASPIPPPIPPRSPVFQRMSKEVARSSESLSTAQHTAHHITSSSCSSQEDPPPPVPFRKGGGAIKPDATSPTGSFPTSQLSPSPDGSGGKQAPPVARRLKPSPTSQREGTPPVALGKKPSRRRPPSPPLSPSPPPTVLTRTKTMGRSTTADACTADPASQKRHSLFNSALSPSQIEEVSQNYEVFDRTSEESRQLERLYQESVKSSTETHNKPDSDQGQSLASTRKSRTTHYEMTFLDPERPPKLLKNASSSASGASGGRGATAAPPAAATTVGSPLSSDDTPPPLPSQPIPKKKDRQQTLLKRGPIKARESLSPPSQKSDDAGTKSDSQSVSSECSASPSPKDRIYDVISDAASTAAAGKKPVKTRGAGFFRKMTRNDSKGSDPELGSDSTFRREAKSFSAFTFRRSNSDRFKKNKLPIVVPTEGNAFAAARRQTVHRTPSVDKLDDRMERSVKMSGPQTEGDSSSDDEDDEETVQSPTQQGLPQPPLPRYTEPPKSHKKEDRPVSGYVVPADEEPLYQYINTAEFLRTPQENVKTGLTKNQLEIARQLSSRRLWCEQPEIINSGVLEGLSEDEKKLQEAMFEVVTTEATYLRSLDVLIEHFMEDPGMNPHLPEGRRVLDKRQHHVIFSNVQEVREVSARFLEELRARQNETAVIKGIADIILEYAERKFDCYIRYCTNQIYQTRELQECLEKNVMFREYLRRLEKHKRCQHLSMQSFLLLPMQRITRLPLLILAILNKTPLDHPDHRLVENALRTIQKLVMECNDGARRMERTEQLHNIHQQLDFGKLKPFPLVSASRQLEKKGTVMRLLVEQKLFGRHQIKSKQLYLFVFTDLIIITKRKKDPKGEYVFKVVDYASRAVVEMEDIGTHPGMSFPKHTFGEQDTVANATWAVSSAGVNHAFLLILLDNVNRQSEKYIFVAQNDTDKTRWMESLATPESQREDEKIYQTWDCPQVQAIYDYKAAQPDELSLERGDVVKVYRKMADGWYEGERLRDLQWGWFPSNFTTEIENEHTRARNLRETHRLLSLPYSPEEYAAKITTLR